MAAFALLHAMVLFLLLNKVRSQCPDTCTCTTETIDCSSRGFTSLPDVTKPDLVQTFRLAKIDFSNNLLQTLDIDRLFMFIKGLQVDELDFSSNEIREVNGSFDAKDGKDFGTFNLSRNALQEFPRSLVPVNHFQGKYVVDVSYNRLTELWSEMFAGGEDRTLPGFQFIATNNMISSVAADAFQGVTVLEAIIDLRSNFLRSIPEDFQPPQDLLQLKISGNPWNCSCDLRWIITPANRLVNLTADDPPSCQTPAGVRGRPIFELKGDDFACLPYQNGPLRQNFIDMDSYIVRCPVTADPPRFEVSWQVWFPIGDETGQLFFTSETVGIRELQAIPSAAFKCTARNNAGSITLPLDIRYNGVPGIPAPECPQVLAPEEC